MSPGLMLLGAAAARESYSSLEWVLMAAGALLCVAGTGVAVWLKARMWSLGRRPSMPLRSQLRWFGVMMAVLGLGLFLFVTAAT